MKNPTDVTDIKITEIEHDLEGFYNAGAVYATIQIRHEAFHFFEFEVNGNLYQGRDNALKTGYRPDLVSYLNSLKDDQSSAIIKYIYKHISSKITGYSEDEIDKKLKEKNLRLDGVSSTKHFCPHLYSHLINDPYFYWGVQDNEKIIIYFRSLRDIVTYFGLKIKTIKRSIL